MSTYPTDPTTTSDDPEVLRRQIEQTRSDLSRNVDALGEAASPGNIARRQAEKVGDSVRGAGHSLKEKVMGSSDPYDTEPGLTGRTSEAASAVGSKVGDVAGSARDAVASTPSAVKQQARGNPLAAGLVALGAGWLLGSLLPGSEKERELAVAAKEQVRDSGLAEEVSAAAKNVVEEIKPQAQEAMDKVRTSAAEGAEHVKEDAASTAPDVKSSAQESKDTVQGYREQGGSL
ncbi:DUF3618 domain-containing protein [Ornithinimicrobium cerasi]|uniref:DUF3618 domain-containing protein n=1 Tax=Ornithinimicrobium cerasi TaxID=2248773 RepID=UPI000F00DF20|nr:DUF3618 domain-containing protein [Ornithinimicrobium cerasi]